MPFMPVDDTEHAERRWMTLYTCRYRRTCDQDPVFVKRDTLIRDRDDDLERTLRSVLKLLLRQIGFCAPRWIPVPEIAPPESGFGPEHGPRMRGRPCRKQAKCKRCQYQGADK